MLKVIHKSLAFTMSLLIMLTTLSVYPITASAAETASHTWVDATITNSPYWETSFNGKVTQYQYIVKHLINGEPAFCLDVSVSSNKGSASLTSESQIAAWNNLSENQKKNIQLAMQYGSLSHTNSVPYYFATQFLIWDIQSGARTDFVWSESDYKNYNLAMNNIKVNSRCEFTVDEIKTAYKQTLAEANSYVQAKKNDSYFSTDVNKAKTIELEYNATTGSYEANIDLSHIDKTPFIEAGFSVTDTTISTKNRITTAKTIVADYYLDMSKRPSAKFYTQGNYQPLLVSGKITDFPEMYPLYIKIKTKDDGSLTITKRDTVNNSLLTGAKFKIVNTKSAVLSFELVENEKGKYSVANIPYGTYYLYETKLPDNVIKNDGTIVSYTYSEDFNEEHKYSKTISINSSSKNIIVYNDPLTSSSKIRVGKYGYQYDENGNKLNSIRICSGDTNKNGQLDEEDVTIIRNAIAYNEAYNEVYDFDKNGVVNVVDTTKIIALIEDGYTFPNLGGAVFGLYDSNNNLISTASTSDGFGGDAIFSVPTKNIKSTYYIKEISAPEGYIKSDVTKEVVVSAKFKGEIVLYNDSKTNKPIFHNDANGKIEITKNWVNVNGEAVTPTNDDVKNTSFTIYSLDNGNYPVVEYVSNKNDVITYRYTGKTSTSSTNSISLSSSNSTSKIVILDLPLGSYKISEKTSNNFSCGASKQVLVKPTTNKVTFTNTEKTSSVVINKVWLNSLGHNITPTADAKKETTFIIKNAKGKTVWLDYDSTTKSYKYGSSMVNVKYSNFSDDSITITGLPSGTYTITENGVNDGYIAKTGVVTVTTQPNKTSTVTFTNREKTATLNITKKWVDVNGNSIIPTEEEVNSTYFVVTRNGNNLSFLKDGYSDDLYSLIKTSKTATQLKLAYNSEASQTLKISNLPTGTYTIKEYTTDDYNAKSDSNTWTVKITQSQTTSSSVIDFGVTNKQRGAEIVIEKDWTDVFGNTQTPDSTAISKTFFTLKNSKGQGIRLTYNTATKIYTYLETNNSKTSVIKYSNFVDGSCKIEGLPADTYTITEFTTDDYGTKVRQNVVAKLKQVVTASFTNKEIGGQITINKTWKDLYGNLEAPTSDTLKSTYFVIEQVGTTKQCYFQYENGEYVCKANTYVTPFKIRMRTDKTQESLVVSNLPEGTYTITEYKPYYYNSTIKIDNVATSTFTIENGCNIIVDVENRENGKDVVLDVDIMKTYNNDNYEFDNDYLYGTSIGGDTFDKYIYNKNYPTENERVWFSVSFPTVKNKVLRVRQVVTCEDITKSRIVTINGKTSTESLYDFEFEDIATVTDDRYEYIVTAYQELLDANDNVITKSETKSFYVPIKPKVRYQLEAYNIEGERSAVNGDFIKEGTLYAGQRVKIKYGFSTPNSWVLKLTSSFKELVGGRELPAFKQNNGLDFDNPNVEIKDLNKYESLLTQGDSVYYTVPRGTYSNGRDAEIVPATLTSYWAYSDETIKNTKDVKKITLPVVVPDAEIEDIRIIDDDGYYVTELYQGQEYSLQYVVKNNTSVPIYTKAYYDKEDVDSHITGDPDLFYKLTEEGKEYEVNTVQKFVTPFRVEETTIWGGIYLESVENGDVHYEKDGTNNEMLKTVTVLNPLSLEIVAPNDKYREKTDVITTFKVINHMTYYDVLPEDNAYVKFVAKVGDRVIYEEEKAVVIPADSTNIVYYKWNVPTDLDYADITLEGYLYYKNEFMDDDTGIGLSVPRHYEETPDTQFEKTAPAGWSNPFTPNTRTNSSEWSQYIYDETTGEFELIKSTATVKATAQITPDADAPSSTADTMRSGYGFDIKVNPVIELTGYDDEDNHTPAQSIDAAFPEFKYARTIDNYRTLEFVGGEWVFAKNPYTINQDGTQTLERLHFTPIWYPDGDYCVSCEIYDVWTPAGMISARIDTNNITISGNMYDDWYTTAK